VFLSKLILNPCHRQARYDLARPYEMHRTLMNGYPYVRVKDRCDLLFRLDPSRAGPSILLVQTREDPGGWSPLPDRYLLRPAECKPLDLAVAPGKRLRFRLRANPTKRIDAKNERLGKDMAGKRVGLTSEAEQIRWLIRKADQGGFRIPGGWVPARRPDTDEPIELPNFRVDVVPEGRARTKPGNAGELLAVRFEGVLEVTDPERFQAAVAGGIGTGKAFGFGLLSVAPA
jgi:CRISPR system Cascade subunit CasE